MSEPRYPNWDGEAHVSMFGSSGRLLFFRTDVLRGRGKQGVMLSFGTEDLLTILLDDERTRPYVLDAVDRYRCEQIGKRQ